MSTYNVRVEQREGAVELVDRKVGTIKDPVNSNIPTMTIQTPSDFGGPKDENNQSLEWTPEHLFVASAAVCFFTTFVTVAGNSNLSYKTIKIDASGAIGEVEEWGGRCIPEIELRPTVFLNADQSEKKTKRILEIAEERCLVAHSMKTKVILKPEIIKE